MEIEGYKIGFQVYLLPAIKITHDKILNGSYEICIMFLKWGISIRTK